MEHLQPAFLPYGRQSISEADIAAVNAILRSDFLTCGPAVEHFEARFAEKVGAKYAVAVNSATSALHLALLVAGVGKGCRVITSPNTFLASANCAAYTGALPDFADIDPVSYNLAPDAVATAWRDDVKAVVVVDYAGQPADLPTIAEFARSRGAIVIEDACHAVGSGFVHRKREWRVGGHPWADLTVFSFHPVKTMTSGEGGMLVTDRGEWAQRARRLRSHGMQRAEFAGLGSDATGPLEEQGPWYYEMQELGFNYRLTDIQCALGLSQLERLDSFIERRRQIVATYNHAFVGLPWLTTPGIRGPSDASRVAWHLYTVQIDFPAIGRNRTDTMAELRRAGVGSQVLYIPVHLQPWYRQTFGYATGKCPVAERYYLRALSLPLFPAMSDGDVERVVEAVRGLSPHS